MKPSNRGFTLFQSLVAITVLGLVGTLAIMRAATSVLLAMRAHMSIPQQLDSPRHSHV